MFQYFSETSHIFLKKGFICFRRFSILLGFVKYSKFQKNLQGALKMDKKELLILSHFRKNARNNLTSISRDTGIPVSTLFDKLKNYEGKIIKKHTSLIDFTKLGYDVRVQLLLKVKKETKDDFESFLMKHLVVNAMYKINNGFDYMIETLFKTMNEYHEFAEKLDSFGILKKNEFFILQEMRREAFLNDTDLVEIMR
jgi:DNA-binding Lrp family transcriptional regulator